MNFPMPFVRDYTVRRARLILDPYSGQETAPDWDNATEWTVQGFLAHTTSTELVTEPNRQNVRSDATLTIPDPNADVQRGDRVADGDGRTWIVQGFAQDDVNPFTGWQPTRVCQLAAWNG